MTVRELKEMVNKIDEKFLDSDIYFCTEDLEGGDNYGICGSFELDTQFQPIFWVTTFTDIEAYKKYKQK